MTRAWLHPVLSFLILSYGLAVTAALGAPGGQSQRSGGGQSRGGNFQSGNFKPTVLNNRVTSGGSPLKPTTPFKPIGASPLKPTTPKFPSSPLTPTKPTGPIVGPIKPPGGPFKPPLGPIKPPKGPVVGPIKPPVGPFPPVGPIKPPGGGGGGSPPGGGGTGGGHHKHCWPTIVLGCLPCGGGYGGGYCPPVYTTPIYTQPAVVPVAVPVVVASAAPTTAVVAVSEPTPVSSALVGTEAAASSTLAEKLPQVPVGSTLALQAKELGSTKGQVLLVIDKLTLDVQIDEWAAEHTIATLPQLGITSPTKAVLVVVRADGKAASSVKVELVAAQAESSTGLAAINR